MGKITVVVKINTFGNMLYSLNHPSIFSLKEYFIYILVPRCFEFVGKESKWFRKVE